MELLIGSHVSYTKDSQLLGSVEEAINYGGKTFMFYTGAPQNSVRTDIDNELIKRAKELMKEHHINIKDVVVHAPYLVNLANDTKHHFAITFLKQEIKRCEQLGINKMVIHPGSHIGLGIEEGIDNIVAGLNSIIDPDQKVIICLELMSGKGSECGTNFNELKRIISNVKYSDKVGVCLDTCHLNDAGYNMANFNRVLDEFDQIIGLDKLLVMHINDSKNAKGSHKDRHANIGYGSIGFNNLLNIIYHPKLKNIPKILETPYIDDGIKGTIRAFPPYKFEIDMIKAKKFNDKLYEDIKKYYLKTE